MSSLNGWLGPWNELTYWSDAQFRVHGIVTPEPATLVLLGVGAISLPACGWRKRAKTHPLLGFVRGSVASFAF